MKTTYHRGAGWPSEGAMRGVVKPLRGASHLSGLLGEEEAGQEHVHLRVTDGVGTAVDIDEDSVAGRHPDAGCQLLLVAGHVRRKRLALRVERAARCGRPKKRPGLASHALREDPDATPLGPSGGLHHL